MTDLTQFNSVVVRDLSQIRRTSDRYATAVARNPDAASLKPMLDTVGALARELFARDVTLREVAEAAGIEVAR